MGIDVMSKIKHEKIINQECIQCGACIDNSPKNALTFGMIERKENSNGKWEKDWLCDFRFVKPWKMYAETILSKSLNDDSAHKYL